MAWAATRAAQIFPLEYHIDSLTSRQMTTWGRGAERPGRSSRNGMPSPRAASRRSSRPGATTSTPPLGTAKRSRIARAMVTASGSGGPGWTGSSLRSWLSIGSRSRVLACASTCAAWPIPRAAILGSPSCIDKDGAAWSSGNCAMICRSRPGSSLAAVQCAVPSQFSSSSALPAQSAASRTLRASS